MDCTTRRFCDRMEERLNEEANHGKGLTVLAVTNMRTGKVRKLGVFHKKSERDRGLMLTFCPWCGVNLLELFHLAGTGTGKFPVVERRYAP